MKEEINGLIFDSDFDSGNLAGVEDVSSSTQEEYVCTVRCDCEGTPHANANSSWFYFTIHGGVRGRSILLHVKTQNVQAKLFGFDMRPVVKVGDGNWARITTRPDTATANQQHFLISWPHAFVSSESVSIAFTYPYPFDHLCNSISLWEQRAKQARICFERTVLTRTLEGRDVEMLTITGAKGREVDKKVVLLSARVHPGETPASYMLHGLIDLLCRNDSPIAALLRATFVFKIVPCLNPDGVARGHYRTDTLGVNLNRMFEHPRADKHPTIYVMKKLFLAQHDTGRLLAYIDFHAHATKRGCFVYGNALGADRQPDNLLFPMLLGLYSEHFAYDACNFTQKNMKMKGKKDGLSKKGTGRVALHRETGFVRCYTLEANYNKGLPTEAEPCPAPYTPAVFYSVGEAVLSALLDMVERHPSSILQGTAYGDLATLRGSLVRAKPAPRRPGSAAGHAGGVASGTYLKAKRASIALPTLGGRAEDNVGLRGGVQGAFRPRSKRHLAPAVEKY